MKHIPSHIQSLVQKYFDGTISPSEKVQLDEWYRSFAMDDTELLEDGLEENVQQTVFERLQKLVRADNSKRKSRKLIIFRAAAIFILLLASVTIYFSTKSTSKEEIIVTTKAPKKNEIVPGGNKAILTLSDGSSIILDSANNGSLSKQGDIIIIKTGDGLLEYQDKNLNSGGKTAYNTVSTPRGGQYRIELADGTNVWLNASSSLRFPVSFDDSIRQVEATGEVYFEVAKNAKKPFRVKLKDSQIEVLGTHFNVMAYENEEAVNTTLLEGSLKVVSDKSSKLLKPGQRAVSYASGSITVNTEDSPDDAIAWVKGKFLFHSADIKNIMRQVERWYDAEVVFEKEIDLHFTGELNRSDNVSGLLRKLELTNEVHFKIDKKKITVMP